MAILSFLHCPKKKQKTLAHDCSPTRDFLNSEIQRTPPKAFGVKQRWIFTEFSKSDLRAGWLLRYNSPLDCYLTLGPHSQRAWLHKNHYV